MRLENAEELRNIFKSNLIKISKGRFKSEQQKSALENVKLLYKSRQVVFKFLNKYSLIASESKHKAKYGEGLKILSPKQMLQRLPIDLAQAKAGNKSENLLKEIRQIIFSLYREKEIIKKVYNNITNSKKL